MIFLLKILEFPFREIKDLMRTSEREDPILNGLRGMSALMIVFYHSLFCVFLILKDKTGLFIDNEVPGFLSFIFSFDKAVDIFFVLSAYLLTRQLVREVSQKGSINFSRFYQKRFFRIYPLFLVALALYSLGYLNDLFPRIFYNLSFISNFFGNFIIPVGWSLDIEVQFYLIIPFIILLLRHIPKYLILLSVLFLSILIRYFLGMETPDLFQVNFYDLMMGDGNKVFLDRFYYPTYSRFGPLVLGILWGYWDQESRGEWLKKRGDFLTSIFFILQVFLLYVSMEFPGFHKNSWFYENNIYITSVHRILFSFSVVVIISMIQNKALPKLIQSRLQSFWSHSGWRVFSQLSYPIYLFHFPFVALAYVLIFQTVDPKSIEMIKLWQVFVAFLLATAMTVYLSLFLHKYIEKPFMRRGRGAND